MGMTRAILARGACRNLPDTPGAEYDATVISDATEGGQDFFVPEHM
jgi:hypothetical protein